MTGAGTSFNYLLQQSGAARLLARRAHFRRVDGDRIVGADVMTAMTQIWVTTRQ
jgi:hypothetical protein